MTKQLPVPRGSSEEVGRVHSRRATKPR